MPPAPRPAGGATTTTQHAASARRRRLVVRADDPALRHAREAYQAAVSAAEAMLADARAAERRTGYVRADDEMALYEPELLLGAAHAELEAELRLARQRMSERPRSTNAAAGGAAGG